MKQKRISMPVRYGINLVLTIALWAVLFGLIRSGSITNYWSGILVTVGINIILAVSLNMATGYLGQLPLGHAGFMAVGAYTGGIFLKSTPVDELLKTGNTAGCLPYIVAALLLSGIMAGIFGLIIGIPALRLKGDYLAIITLGFGEIIRVVLTNIDSVLGFKFTYGAAGLKRIPKISSFTLVFLCVALTCLIIHMVMKSRHGRAIMSKPKLLMLDEPSMGLAPILVDEIFDIVKTLHAGGTTILLVEQNAQMALSVADRGYVLETGRIVTSGTGAELLADEAVKKAYLGG